MALTTGKACSSLLNGLEPKWLRMMMLIMTRMTMMTMMLMMMTT